MNDGNSSPLATSFGICGLFVWAMTACVAINLSNIPAFEFLTLTSFMTFLIACTRLTIKKSWHKIRQPLSFWVIGSICIPMNLLGYFCSFRYIDASLADLIYYMYPILVVLLGAVLFRKRLTLKTLISLILCFTGIVILLAQEIERFPEKGMWQGVLLAFLGSISWAVYSLSTKIYADSPFEMVGLFFGIGSLFALVFHLQNEIFILPTLFEFSLMIFWAFIVHNFSISMWEFGMRKGDFDLLNILSFTVPVISVCLLVICGFTPFTMRLVIATTIIAIGLILNRTGDETAPVAVTE